MPPVVRWKYQGSIGDKRIAHGDRMRDDSDNQVMQPLAEQQEQPAEQQIAEQSIERPYQQKPPLLP